MSSSMAILGVFNCCLNKLAVKLSKELDKIPSKNVQKDTVCKPGVRLLAFSLGKHAAYVVGSWHNNDWIEATTLFYYLSYPLSRRNRAMARLYRNMYKSEGRILSSTEFTRLNSTNAFESTKTSEA